MTTYINDYEKIYALKTFEDIFKEFNPSDTEDFELKKVLVYIKHKTQKLEDTHLQDKLTKFLEIAKQLNEEEYALFQKAVSESVINFNDFINFLAIDLEEKALKIFIKDENIKYNILQNINSRDVKTANSFKKFISNIERNTVSLIKEIRTENINTELNTEKENLLKLNKELSATKAELEILTKEQQAANMYLEENKNDKYILSKIDKIQEKLKYINYRYESLISTIQESDKNIKSLNAKIAVENMYLTNLYYFLECKNLAFADYLNHKRQFIKSFEDALKQFLKEGLSFNVNIQNIKKLKENNAKERNLIDKLVEKNNQFYKSFLENDKPLNNCIEKAITLTKALEDYNKTLINLLKDKRNFQLKKLNIMIKNADTQSLGIIEENLLKKEDIINNLLSHIADEEKELKKEVEILQRMVKDFSKTLKQALNYKTSYIYMQNNLLPEKLELYLNVNSKSDEFISKGINFTNSFKEINSKLISSICTQTFVTNKKFSLYKDYIDNISSFIQGKENAFNKDIKRINEVIALNEEIMQKLEKDNQSTYETAVLFRKSNNKYNNFLIKSFGKISISEDSLSLIRMKEEINKLNNSIQQEFLKEKNFLDLKSSLVEEEKLDLYNFTTIKEVIKNDNLNKELYHNSRAFIQEF